MSTTAPNEGQVGLEVANGVARVLIDRPAARNAMTWRMYDDLLAACRRIDADPAVRVAVLRGAGGKAFVAGTDIEQFHHFGSGQDGVDYEEKVDRYVAALEALRVPTVAVVEGWAVGGGLLLANACDVRLAATGARFGVPIAKTLGNTLSPANLRRLCATIGVSWVRRMLLLAEMPTAEELAPTGYLAAVSPPGPELDARVEETCRRLLDHAPITMRVTREMLRRLAADPHAAAADLIAECYGSADFRHGIESFSAKETPRWQDR